MVPEYSWIIPSFAQAALLAFFSERPHGAVGSFVDNICLFAMAGGVAIVLGVANTQFSVDLEYVFGIESNKTLWVIIVGAIVFSHVGLCRF